MARPVSKKEAAGDKKCVEASAKEWARIMLQGVWKLNDIREWSRLAGDARKAGKTVHLGRIFVILVEKNSELEMKHRKRKYLAVFQGDNVVTQNWESALCQDLGSSLACMEVGEAIDAYGCMAVNDNERADAEQAYIQAYLEGEETWVCLCDEFQDHPGYWKVFRHPAGTRIYNRPCVRLIWGLYGHPDAGSCWQRHCDSSMNARGFLPITSWPSCYYRTELRLVLMIYVHDFKLTGPTKHLAQRWKLINDAVEMGRREELGQFLGCSHEKIVKMLPIGAVLRGVRCNVASYLKTLVIKHKKLVKEVTGSEPNMCTVRTHFLPEDQADAPARLPIMDFPAMVCPSCDHSFPIWELGKERSGLCCGRCDVDMLKTKLPFGSTVS